MFIVYKKGRPTETCLRGRNKKKKRKFVRVEGEKERENEGRQSERGAGSERCGKVGEEEDGRELGGEMQGKTHW